MWGLRPLCRVARGPGWRAWSSAPGAVVDVAIAGGGLVGAAFAAALGAPPPWPPLWPPPAASAQPPAALPSGPRMLTRARCPALLAAANPLTSSLSVVLLDPHPPAALPRELPPIPSSHVAALNPASVALLRSVGAWRALAPAAAPFCDMQVQCLARLRDAGLAAGPMHGLLAGSEPSRLLTSPRPSARCCAGVGQRRRRLRALRRRQRGSRRHGCVAPACWGLCMARPDPPESAPPASSKTRGRAGSCAVLSSH